MGDPILTKTFQDLILETDELNQSIFSLTRIKILHSLFYLGPDGATFREMSAGLGIPDGLLYSNLKKLEEMGLIRSQRIELEGKNLESYHFTEEGFLEWKRSIKWMNEFINYGRE
jgi:DNA-binding MarR family transcriptional regulator